ncbi:hypothetical protein [Lederbergia panacisoli]|uniref:hypothetical protein n=1 Tax=Lederbergia panacisoli TaxID=1255251 RepID=UPI00214B3D43|nr:hypothetical protein [Lederbergia panacisoli]MCR2823766.1 hypothetical protein [Lederbergia panacisoli]
MKDIKGFSIKIIVLLLIISLFFNLKLIKDTREFKNELGQKNGEILQNLYTDIRSVLKTMNTSISNNNIYVGENEIITDYYDRDLREVSRNIRNLSYLRSELYSSKDLKKIDTMPLVKLLDSFSTFLELLYQKNQNELKKYIGLDSNDLEGISIIKDTMEDLMNMINVSGEKKDRLINTLVEFTNYAKSKEFEEKRLKIEELNNRLSQG